MNKILNAVKKLDIFFILILLGVNLVGCGLKSGAKSDTTQNLVNVPIFRGSLEICDSSSFGCVSGIRYEGKLYVVGNETGAQINQTMDSLSEGQNYPVRFSGTFDRESGHFPNPSSTIDVIHLEILYID